MDTASLATRFLFGTLLGVAALLDFGEKRCRKNLPLADTTKMATTFKFEPDDAYYFECIIGEPITFYSAWSSYCYIARICFSNQCNDPEFAPYRENMAAAIQRGISAGLVILSDNRISLSPELASRFEALRDSNCNGQPFEVVDEFLQSRLWDVVSDAQLQK